MAEVFQFNSVCSLCALRSPRVLPVCSLLPSPTFCSGPVEIAGRVARSKRVGGDQGRWAPHRLAASPLLLLCVRESS